MCVLVLLVAG